MKIKNIVLKNKILKKSTKRLTNPFGILQNFGIQI